MEETRLHGSAVALEGRAALFTGASGSGKSGAALRLMALGAALVADDQVIVRRSAEGLSLHAPEPLRGMIEIRGIGLVSADHVESARLCCIVDMEQTELHRLPPQRTKEILGIPVDVVYGRGNPLLDVGVLALLKGARVK